MSGIRDKVSEEEAAHFITPIVCPKCGNSSERKNENDKQGIHYWWHETSARTAAGEFRGKLVVNDDVEGNDFDEANLAPGKLTHGLCCEQCRHEWAVPNDDPFMDEYDVQVALGLEKTEARLTREGWTKVIATGSDIAAGDLLLSGAELMRVASVELMSNSKGVICYHGSRGNGGSCSRELTETVVLYRQKAKTVVSKEVAEFVTSHYGREMNRFTLEGLRVNMEPHFDKRSVYAFLDAWTQGTPANDCWHLLKPKSPEPEEKTE